MATIRALPSKAEVLARGQREAKGFAPVAVRGDPNALARARVQATRNITTMYHDAPAATKQAGREWYPKAHDEAVAVGRTAGSGTRAGAGIIAAVSPSMSWENNIPAAHQMARLSDHHIVSMAAANERQKGLASEIALHERTAAQAAGNTKLNAKVKGAAPAHLYAQHEQARREHMASRQILAGTPLNNQSTDNIVKASRIRSGEDPETVLPSHLKTGNFFRNVHDPSDPHPVTVDTHAHDAARMSKLPFATTRGLKTKARYDHFADAYRAAVPRVGVEHGHEVQATVWQHWKDRYGTDTSVSSPGSKSRRASFDEEELSGHEGEKQARRIAARSAATVKKHGRPVDPAAQAAGW